MKRTAIIVLTVFVASCGKPVSLEGTYARKARAATGDLYDTLDIVKQGQHAYSIEKRTIVRLPGAALTTDGKRTIKSYTGTFDSGTQILQLNDPSKSYTYDSKKKTLSKGELHYQAVTE